MIYIFGAAFDPPHVGHSAIIRALLHYKNPEKIVLIPSSKRNDKSYHVSDEHRLAMLEIFANEINDSAGSVTLTKEESAQTQRIGKIFHSSSGQKQRVFIDDFFIKNWEGEMITRDVDIYAREKYSEDIVHVFGTDTTDSMPEWDEEGYAAKVVKKLFVPRGDIIMNKKKNQLKEVIEGKWCRFSPGKGGVRGGYTEYNPSLAPYAKENRKIANYMEKNMWFLLRGNKLGYKFHRQKPIGEYIVDFYSPALRLAIEIDGESHVSTIQYDTTRNEYINSLGIHVLRFTNSELNGNLEGVQENLKNWIQKIEEHTRVTPPSLPFSGEGMEQLVNYELFADSHIPVVSSTEIRKTIPEYTTLKTLFEENPKFIIKGLSNQISKYILEKRLYRSPPEKGEPDGVTQKGIHKSVTHPNPPLSGRGLKPRVLVHVCCGPDVTMPILQLRDEYDVICFWYDPNIQPKSEYDKRYEAFVRVCEIENIPYIKGVYDVGNFFTRIRGVEHTPERGEKCTYCYDMRMMVSAKLAKRLKIPYYTSSLNTSPKKDLEKLFKMGHLYAEKYGVEFLDIPFRKRGGFEKSVEYTREHDIYRQNYCGCIYSIREGGESEMKKRMVG